MVNVSGYVNGERDKRRDTCVALSCIRFYFLFMFCMKILISSDLCRHISNLLLV